MTCLHLDLDGPYGRETRWWLCPDCGTAVIRTMGPMGRLARGHHPRVIPLRPDVQPVILRSEPRPRPRTQ